MDELESDRDKVSVKPLLLVAAMFVAAGIGAVATLRPVPHPARPHRAPPAAVVVLHAPRAQVGQRHVGVLRLASSKAVSGAGWV